MLVTLPGMVTLVKPVQLEKAEWPMLVTLSGMVMLIKLVHPLKASSPMVVPLVIVTANEVDEVDVVWRATLLALFAEPVMLVKPVQ